MPKLYIDRPGAERFFQVAQDIDPDGLVRRSYVTRQNDERLVLLMCRGGLELESLVGEVVDAAVGWDHSHLGFAFEGEVGLKRTKITLFRQLGLAPGEKAEALSDLLRGAPARR